MKNKELAITLMAVTLAGVVSLPVLGALSRPLNGASMPQQVGGVSGTSNYSPAQAQQSSQKTESAVSTDGPALTSNRPIMTDEEKAELRTDVTSKLATDVTNGKITQTEADEILANFDNGIMPPKSDEKAPVDLSTMTDEEKAELRIDVASKLATDVTNGKITQTEADEILADFDNGIMPSNKDEKAPVDLSTMTDEEKAELRIDIASKLATDVTNGKITQTEADEILADFDNGIMPSKLDNSIKVKFNDKLINMDTAPLVIENRTIVPARAIAEALGATVTWSSTDQAATITLNETEIVIKAGDTYATVNGESVELDVPAQIFNNRMFLPIRFISEQLGTTVTWDDSSKTINITD